jgi:serine/threonine-protein kinase
MNGTSETDPWTGAGRGLSPGDTIGPYELLFRAGEGGMATVWAARRTGSRGFRQIVAIKALSDSLRNDADGRAMFLDEARTVARITHPNVGQVLDYGEDGGRPYLVMEWIEGETLARIASARRTRTCCLPLRWVLHVASAACAGLHAAHEARDDDGELLNLVHRDVSPQNVMVTFDGVTKVVDFGVAKSRRRVQVTRVGVIKGKTGYFSPEQIAGRELDRRSDIFSFGILLYVLVTDHHPFRGRSAIDTVQNISTREPFPPRMLIPDVPPALDALILRALAKDPADRFPTAAELGRELERVSMDLGGPLPAREIGAQVEAMLPGLARFRRARLARAAEQLDSGVGPEEPSISVDLPCRAAADEATRPEVRGRSGAGRRGVHNAPQREPDGPASRTPRPTAIAGRAALPSAARRSSSAGVLTALALLAAAAIATRAGDPGSPGRSSRSGTLVRAESGIASSVAEAVQAVEEQAPPMDASDVKPAAAKKPKPGAPAARPPEPRPPSKKERAPAPPALRGLSPLRPYTPDRL